MSLRDFNIDGKMMNKTFDTFCSRNYPKQIFSKTHGQLVGMHDENVFWLTVYNKNETFKMKCFWINPSHLGILPKNVF